MAKGLVMDRNEAHHRQQFRLAIEAAKLWGYSRPRRWSAKYAALGIARGDHSAELNAEYRQHRKTIAALVPKIQVSAEWF